VERALQPGDVVVFYTDGLIEAVNANDEQFGFERLLQVLSQMRQQSATEIKKALFEAVNAFAGEQGSIRDDLTILVVKRCATERRQQTQNIGATHADIITLLLAQARSAAFVQIDPVSGSAGAVQAVCRHSQWQ